MSDGWRASKKLGPARVCVDHVENLLQASVRPAIFGGNQIIYRRDFEDESAECKESSLFFHIISDRL